MKFVNGLLKVRTKNLLAIKNRQMISMKVLWKNTILNKSYKITGYLVFMQISKIYIAKMKIQAYYKGYLWIILK